jgi:PadR family transcriptional regulator, regulatory protein PadR
MTTTDSMEFHDLLTGFVRIHILHHAAEGEVYGRWLIEELARHSYRISPGTLYPMLQSMEERGYLISREDSDGRLGRRRKVYIANPGGATWSCCCPRAIARIDGRDQPRGNRSSQ